jgi:uncharacterized protein YjbI with pentapeptide repeats
MFITFVVLAYRQHWQWTGLPAARSEPTDAEGSRPKTLWDWLQLLVIPLALAGLAFLLNSAQTDREQRREDRRVESQGRRAADSAREETLRTYLTQMSSLMLDRQLLQSKEHATVRAVARTVTLTALRRLDGERKAVVIRFLAEADLLSFRDPRVVLDNADLVDAHLARSVLIRANLTGANLRDADLTANLMGANLSGANLSGADLHGSVVSRAVLRGANFVGADLTGAAGDGADFGGADLSDATVSQTNLSRADLSGADLSRADLSNADLSNANLASAILSGATLSGADLTGTDLAEGNLSDTNVSDTNLSGGYAAPPEPQHGTNLGGSPHQSRTRTP